MRFVYFTHSLVSCWNHGNAHFLRGVLRELALRGHDVVAYEPRDGWSRANLIAEHGSGPLAAFARDFPELTVIAYEHDLELDRAVEGADVVIVHEWNEPRIIAGLGRLRRLGGRFLLFFHDTHHRAVSNPAAMRALDLSAYDGVLAFGEAVAEVYRSWDWGQRAFVWHEAADTRLFRPPAHEGARRGLVWIGNWGDDERSAELRSFLFEPASQIGLPLDVYGVRYPSETQAALERYGANYRGWLPNAAVPSVFSRHLATVHVPRRYYTEVLPGIPTIRVFEALACGIPLLCSWWDDREGLFRPGQDYLVARDAEEMRRHMLAIADDPALRSALAASGLARIAERHTCAHRADELLGIVTRMAAPAEAELV